MGPCGVYVFACAIFQHYEDEFNLEIQLHKTAAAAEVADIQLEHTCQQATGQVAVNTAEVKLNEARKSIADEYYRKNNYVLLHECIYCSRPIYLGGQATNGERVALIYHETKSYTTCCQE